MKTKKQFLGLIAIAIMAIAIIALPLAGCKEDEPDPPPQPVPQSYLIDLKAEGGTSTAKVTVNYTALPGVVPGYMGNLKIAIMGAVGNSAKTGNLTVNVVSGSDGFTTPSGKLTVGESWLIGKDADNIMLGMPSISSWTS
jgi:hypothetical protein